MQTVLRAANGGAVTAVGPALPDAHDRLIRRHLLLYCAIERREGARSFVAVAHAVGSAARALGFALNLIAECGLVPGSRRADRRRCLDNAALRPILRRTTAKATASC